MTTSNKKKSKRQSLIALCLIGALAITGIFAFLTATTDTKVNSFTVGNIEIELDEGAWEDLPDADNDEIPDEAENLVSGKTIVKEPHVINKGTNDAYTFLVVSVPKAEVVTTDDEGFKSPSAVNELFTTKFGADAALNTTDWKLMTSVTDDADYNHYVYGYIANNGILAPEGETSKLFDTVKFANVTEEFAGDTAMQLTIKVQALAIQADDTVNSVDTAWEIIQSDNDVKDVLTGISAGFNA